MNRFCKLLIVGFCLVTFASLEPVRAGVRSEAVQEVAELLLRKGGREVAEETASSLSRKIEALCAQYGEAALEAVRKTGFRTFRLVEQSGDDGPEAIRLLARYGDEAVRIVEQPRSLALAAQYGDDGARAMINHPGIAEPLIEQLQAPAVRALNAVSARNARRLAMMTDSGELQAIGRTGELLAIIGKFGDRAMDFIWRNKGALTVATVLAAFLANPEPFLNSAKELAAPVAAIPGTIVARTDWTLLVGLAGAIAAIYFIARTAWRRAVRRPGKD